MTEDRKHDDDDLSFDDDVAEAGSGHAAAARDPGSASAGPASDPDGFDPFADTDDEEFVLEFDDDQAGDDWLAEDGSAAPGRRPRQLDSMFSGSTAEPVGEASQAEAEALFDGPQLASSHNQFDGARATPQFVEDYAGWHGADADLGEIVGEGSMKSEPDEDTVLRYEQGIDDDPFAIGDVEIEDGDPAQSAAGGFAADESAGLDAESLAVRDVAPPAPQGAMPSLRAELHGDASQPTHRDGTTFHVTDEAGEALDPDVGWDLSVDDGELPEADLEAEEYDPIYGSSAEAEAEAASEYYDEFEHETIDDLDDAPEGDELDEAYVDATPQHTLVGGGAVRRFGLRAVASAALVFVAVGGAVIALKPEWIGLVDRTAVVHRVEIARPRVALDLAAPIAEEATETGGPVAVVPPLDPGSADPQGEPTTPIDPPIIAPVTPVTPADPVAVAPVDPPPVAPLPTVDPLPVEPSPTAVTAASRAQVALEPIEFGDGLEIRSVIDVDEYRNLGVDDIMPGVRAFAQLHNEAIFIGVVKRVEASFVTLDLEPGEVSIARADLTTLAAVDSADASEFTAAEHGYVRLGTEARLWGRILRNQTSDNVILQIEDGRVTIPPASVVDVSPSSKSGSSLVEGDDDGWLDERARQRLRDLRAPDEREPTRILLPIAAPPPGGDR